MREEEKNTSKKTNIQRLKNRRWALPAIYIASAAIILAGAFWMQNSYNDSADKSKEQSQTTGKGFKEPAVEVNSKLETIKMPVADSTDSVIKKQFYDAKADAKEQEAALVSYNNRFEPNKGIDIAMNDGKTFDVVASFSGNVTKVQDDALLGNVVEVEHDNGVVTRYQSITDIKVAVGDQVKQGQTIAKAGSSLINEEAGTHVHFEIRKDNVALNPQDYFEKQVSAIQSASDEKATSEKASSSDKSKTEENDQLDKNLDQSGEPGQILDGTDNETDGSSLDTSDEG
ncbi:peptidoglycan DD-metalloendopeptidase family protein [Actinomycetes bacterium NPDC127524]